jgi:hypothetical protein
MYFLLQRRFGRRLQPHQRRHRLYRGRRPPYSVTAVAEVDFLPNPNDDCIEEFSPGFVKRPDPLGLKCDTITSPRRLVNTFLTSNSTELLLGLCFVAEGLIERSGPRMKLFV